MRPVFSLSGACVVRVYSCLHVRCMYSAGGSFIRSAMRICICRDHSNLCTHIHRGHSELHTHSPRSQRSAHIFTEVTAICTHIHGGHSDLHTYSRISVRSAHVSIHCEVHIILANGTYDMISLRSACVQYLLQGAYMNPIPAACEF